MCTLTWQFLPGGYELHFNRDERRTRAKAQPPAIDSSSPLQSIFPIDPEAGGTWVTVNQSGLSVCLLNNYREINGRDGVSSRGLLVKAISRGADQRDARRLFQAIDITQYNPFDLFLFFPNEHPTRYRWDGESVAELQPVESFMSSSGFDTEQVILERRKQYIQSGVNSLQDYHRSHSPSRSAYSVCMHRPDARTQSYSKIRVDSESCSFWYTDGPPCSEAFQEPLSIERYQP